MSGTEFFEQRDSINPSVFGIGCAAALARE